MFTKTLLAALAVAPSVVSAGSAIVQNHCSSEAYLWSVSYEDIGTMKTIPSGATYSEPYRTASNGGGVSIKIAKGVFGAYDNSLPITQFEYTLNDMIWYDISNINGNPFTTSGLTLTPSVSSCPAKICPAHETVCTAAYNQPDDNSATGACTNSADITFVLCSGDAEPAAAKAVTPSKAAAPVAEKVATPKVTTAAAPATTAAPAAPVVTAEVKPEVINAGEWGIWTTFVTQIVTVQARDAAPEPTALPAKRDDSHVDMHKRAAHRHHFHRHGADVE